MGDISIDINVGEGSVFVRKVWMSCRHEMGVVAGECASETRSGVSVKNGLCKMGNKTWDAMVDLVEVTSVETMRDREKAAARLWAGGMFGSEDIRARTRGMIVS